MQQKYIIFNLGNLKDKEKTLKATRGKETQYVHVNKDKQMRSEAMKAMKQ